MNKKLKELLFKKKFLARVKKAQKILVIAHENPDADAICSALLIEQVIDFYLPNKQIKLIAKGPKTKSYSFIPGCEEIHMVTKYGKVLEGYDLLIFVDSPQLHLFLGDEKESINVNTKNTICIDHHNKDLDTFSLVYQDSYSVSATEVISRIFFSKKLFKNRYPALIALLGILDDSGNLRFVFKESSNVLDTVALLVKTSKVPLNEPITMLTMLTQNQTKLLTSLFNNLTYIKDNVSGNFVYTYLSKKELLNEELAQERSKVITDFKKYYLANITDYPLGFVFQPKYDKGAIYIAPRCADEVSPMARLVAEEFGGGGHDRASGAKIDIDPDTPLDEVAKLVKEKVVLAREKFNKLKK